MSTCDVCHQPLASSDARAVRQHAKSRAHRDAVAIAAAAAAAAPEPEDDAPAAAAGGKQRGKQRRGGAAGKRRGGAAGRGKDAQPCLHCGHPAAAHGASDDEDSGQARGGGNGDLAIASSPSPLRSPCHPPEFVRTPRAGEWTVPFVTGWKNAAHWEGEEWPVEQILDWGCRPGNWRRLPNIDVARMNVPVETFAHAQTVLAAQTNPKKQLWVSFDAADELAHPAWFLATPNSCPPVRLVPTYSNVLVTSGPAVSIGLHQDTDNRELSSAARPPPICTYLTVAQGAKHVMLVPPKSSPADLRLFKELWTGPQQPDSNTDRRRARGNTNADSHHDEEEEEDAEEPRFLFDDSGKPTAEIQSARNRLRQAGGYLFRLSEAQTLLIPKGWHHWVVAEEGLSVTLSGSRY
jgi:hypothetical protein